MCKKFANLAKKIEKFANYEEEPMIAPVLSSDQVPPHIVVDTNVLIGALLGSEGANRRILRACFEGKLAPIMGQALLSEYEDVMSRSNLFSNCPLSSSERAAFLDDFLSVCAWVSIYFGWRPNLRDEADNHVLELAIAGNASAVITNNVKDFQFAELHFPDILILSPKQAGKRFL